MKEDKRSRAVGGRKVVELGGLKVGREGRRMKDERKNGLRSNGKMVQGSSKEGIH